MHTIGHIHPSLCLNSWSINYHKIISRYESTVTGQFFGHSHGDSFEMIYDINNVTRPVGIAYVTGRVTTYSYLNPGYRIYTVDGPHEKSTFEVLDHETYIMNLTDANISMKPKWIKEYSAKVYYNFCLKKSHSIFKISFNNLRTHFSCLIYHRKVGII